jgi:hypothetical protein
MTSHLRPGGRSLRWGKLETRADIEAYVAERREVLTRLCREEAIGEFAEVAPVEAQLELGELAA